MSARQGSATGWIAATLRWGSYLSAGLMLVGLVWVLSAPEWPLAVGSPIPLAQLVAQLRAGNPYSVMQVGVLLLLLTPLLRIAVAAISFWRDGERRYTLVSLVVLAIIVAGLLLGRLGG